MTEEQLKEIEARAAKAKAGPWRAEVCDYNSDRCELINAGDGYDPVVKTDSGVYPPDWPTAQFIAAARTDVPELVEEVRKLRAFIERHASDKADMGYGHCLSCEAFLQGGMEPHKPDCELVALLGKEPRHG